jgi:SNF2 family DNA or RNA helicase
MADQFVGIPSIYPKLLELRKSTTAEFKPSKHWTDNPDYKLRYYQVVGALHMMMLDRMVLGDSCGLGKTPISLAAYSFLLERDPTLKLLVVTTKSSTSQWAEEIKKFTRGITCRVVTTEFMDGRHKISGYAARKLQYGLFKENVMIINYAPIIEEYEAISEVLRPNFMIIFDECTAFKNRKSKTHVSCQFLAMGAKRVYGLSASIIKNGLEEVYGIYDIVVPGLFGRITKFKDKFCQQKMMKLNINGKIRHIPKITGYKNLIEFKQILDPYFLIRRKEEVATELPALISKKIILEMYPEQKELYKQALCGILYEEKVKHEFFEITDKIRNGDKEPGTLKKYEELKTKYEKFLTTEGKKRGKLAALTYCQMVSNGPALVGQPGESSKDDEFIRLIKEELVDEKVIVFTRFKSGIPYLEVLCERNHLKYTKITGDCTDFERGQARQDFQNSKDINIIFITTAGSMSLNLQAAGALIFIDTPWSYGDLMQIIGRAQRIGSLKEHVLLIHFVNKGTIDVRVMNKVTDKKVLSDQILGDTAKGALDFTVNDVQEIDSLFNELMEDAEGESKQE